MVPDETNKQIWFGHLPSPTPVVPTDWDDDEDEDDGRRALDGDFLAAAQGGRSL